MGVPITEVKEVTICNLTGALCIDKALAAAEKNVGSEGHIMSLPEIIDAKLGAPETASLWQNWITGLSEEGHGLDRHGNQLYVVSHGKKSPLTTSRRWKKVFAGPADEILSYGYVRLTDHEFTQLVNSALPLEEIRGKEANWNEPYTIVGKVNHMKIYKSGLMSLDELREDDRFLMAVGSEQRRHALLDKMKNEFGWTTYKNWHRIRDVDYSVPQGRLLFVGCGGSGIGGGLLVTDCRFAWVPSSSGTPLTP